MAFAAIKAGVANAVDAGIFWLIDQEGSRPDDSKTHLNF